MSKESIAPIDQDPIDTTVNYFTIAAIGFVGIGIAYALLKSWLGVPFSFTAPWTSHGSLIEGLEKVWPIFAWGAGVTLFMGIASIIRQTPREREPGYVFIKGTWISFNAGFFEEIIYRWLALFGSMIVIKVTNVVTFGLVKWLYVTLLIPFANWASFDLLAPQFYGPYGWLFAAGIVSANIRFRKGHEYLGLFGVINAWYIGLIFFYLMFNYGLWVAIVAHILYDLCVFWVRSGTIAFQPRFYRMWSLDTLVR